MEITALSSKLFDEFIKYFRRQVATRQGVQSILHELDVNLDLMRLARVGNSDADDEGLLLCAQLLATESLSDPFYEAKRGEDSVLKDLQMISFDIEDDGSEEEQSGRIQKTAMQSVEYLRRKIEVAKILALPQSAPLRKNARFAVRLKNIQICSEALARLLRGKRG